jgi:hypothetical protein
MPSYESLKSYPMDLSQLEEAVRQALELQLEHQPTWKHMTARAQYHRDEALLCKDCSTKETFIHMSWLALECALETPGARQEYLKKIASLKSHQSWLDMD